MMMMMILILIVSTTTATTAAAAAAAAAKRLICGTHTIGIRQHARAVAVRRNGRACSEWEAISFYGIKNLGLLVHYSFILQIGSIHGTPIFTRILWWDGCARAGATAATSSVISLSSGVEEAKKRGGALLRNLQS